MSLVTCTFSVTGHGCLLSKAAEQPTKPSYRSWQAKQVKTLGDQAWPQLRAAGDPGQAANQLIN